MNSADLDETRRAAILQIVQAQGVPLAAIGPRSWELSDFATQSRFVTMTMHGGWLHFESGRRIPRCGKLPGSRRAHQMLRCNATLPGCLNYCVGLRRAKVMLGGDFPVDREHVDEDELPSQVRAACAAFCAALDRPGACETSAVGASLEGCQAPLCVDHETGEATRALCDATGWAHIERGSGQLAITLEVPGQFCQAHAYQVEGHEFRLATTLEIPDELSPSSHHAVGVFLLTACRLVRMARVGVVPCAQGAEYRWEVAWPSFPSPVQFHSGLAALSIACRLTVRELQALCDESIAGTYLRLRACSCQ